MARITVKISKSYNVHIGHSLIKSLRVYLSNLNLGKKVVLVTSHSLNNLHSNKLEKELEALGLEVKKYLISDGDISKNISEYFNLINFLSNSKITKSDTIIGFGGSSVIELAGFCAATYHRGINFISIPTSLASMIENSVGGKTGLNLVGIKDLIGVYFYPLVVLCDLDFLETLPEEEWENGLVSLIKYAILIGDDFFDILMQDDYKKYIDKLIEDVVAYKREIVEIDENNLWESHILDLGNIFAKAIMTLSENSIPYGKALAMGINKIAYVSYKSAGLQKRDYNKIINLLEKYNLRLSLPFSLNLIVDTIKNDNNIYNNSFDIALINKIGRCFVEKVPVDRLDEFFV
ncbi:MAG TPA: 3-dehydroquinate synthase [Clostridiales bacterium]|nr:3-dehydroquinate synthase [Clostridiales bacterium]